MANFFAELKRRHIYRVAAAYAVVAWVLLQLVNNVAPVLDLPVWVARAFLLALIVGFPITLLIAWMRELAPADGATTRATTGKLDWVLIGALVVVLAGLSYQQLAPTTGARTALQASTTNGTSSAGGISVAVLPFANVSGDAAQEFFSDGMTDEITLALAKVPDLHVVARTSAYEFKGQNRNIRAIGQALGASHLIEGSVRRMGDRVRITAQLVRADNGLQLWSDGYDRQLTDIFATQEDIAQAIAGALRVPLGLKQGDTLVRDRTKDLESYEQYLRAKALYRTFAIDEAIAVLEKVVARDPKFAPAWAMLGVFYRRAQVFSLLPILQNGNRQEARRLVQVSLEKSEMAARRALQLDSRNAVAYAALANIQYARRNWSAAEDIFRQALVLDANDADILEAYSSLLEVAGRLKEALRVHQQILLLEPFDPAFKVAIGALMQSNGQNAASIPILEALSADFKETYFPNVMLAQAYAAEGRYGKAADTLLAIKGDQVSRKSVEDAARLLRQAPARVSAPDALPALEDLLNFVYAYVGAPNRVLDNPERALDIDYAGGVAKSIWLPSSALARKTDRFKAYVRKAGLVDYWRARGWPDLCRPMGADDFVCE